MTAMRALFTQTGLKLLAIVAMTLNHVAHLFPLPSIWNEAFLNIGMIAMPLFAKFIAEGFCHTRRRDKYFGRMVVFSIPAHFAYRFAFSADGSLSSAMTTLTLALFILFLFHTETLPEQVRTALIIICLVFTIPSDWGMCAALWALVFDKFREDKMEQIFYFTLVGLFNGVVFGLLFGFRLTLFTFVLAIPFLALYNGQRGNAPKWLKWAEYVYYPAHLVVLRLLSILMSI